MESNQTTHEELLLENQRLKNLVSEQEQALQELKESEKRSLLLSKISPVGIFVCNTNAQPIYWNEKLEEITGMSLGEGEGVGWVNSIYPEDKDRVLKNWQKSVESRSNYYLEYRHITRNGKITWVIAQAVPAYDAQGNFVGHVGSITDITKNKLAEIELLESEDRFRSIVEQSPLSMQIFSPSGVTVRINKAYEKLWGITLEDLKDYNILEDKQLDALGIMSFIQRAFSGEATSIPISEYDTAKTIGIGKKSWILARIYPVKDLDGNVKKVILIHEDITKQKIIEQKLIEAKEKAEEADQLKSAFLANMSHEIRTPMNGILGFIELLNEPNLNHEQIDNYSKIIRKSGKRLLSTINDIIDITKVESGEMDTLISKINLNDILNEIYSFHKPEASSKGLTLHIEDMLLKNQLTIFTDGHKLHGILTNLIKNAIKYTNKGGVTFGYSLHPDYIEFFVKDTGIGIPENRKHAIFNRFEQADIKDVNVLEGSGLGLAIAKAYVDMLGGKIYAESEGGAGATFVFTIPLNQLEDSSFRTSSAQSVFRLPNYRNLTVLVAEDDIISCKLLEKMLEGVFEKIIFAKNGKEAVEFCKQFSKIKLVLMDINMPEMNGFDARDEIKKFKKDIVIIAQTAFAFSGDKEKILLHGFDGYISKPVTKENLLKVIIEKYI